MVEAMITMNPRPELNPEFSDPKAKPTDWSAAREELMNARTYWLSTVRPDGRPHVTPIAAVWLDDALHFTTGSTERKAQNLESNNQVVVATGCNSMEGLDVVVEGLALRITDVGKLQRLADAYLPKYGDLFVHVVRDGGLHAEGAEGEVLAFEIAPVKAFGFAKDPYGQTRWRF